MNAIQKHLEDQKFQNLNNETAVFKLSRKIQQAIGLKEVPKDLNFPMRNFRIIQTNRRFANGWVDLLEINPIGVLSPLGFEGDFKTDWDVEMKGTKSVNLPPVSVVKEFFEELKEYTKEI